jgi:hypothetical protein
MPNKTLYVKDSDLPLWERAQKELGESVSSLFVECLRERLAKHAKPQGKMGKIVVTLWHENQEAIIRKSFTGRWIVGDDLSGTRAHDDDSSVSWDAEMEWSIAQTQKGALAVYVQHCNQDSAPSFEVFDDFESFRDSLVDGRYPSHPANVIAEVADALGDIPYEVELDI